MSTTAQGVEIEKWTTLHRITAPVQLLDTSKTLGIHITATSSEHISSSCLGCIDKHVEQMRSTNKEREKRDQKNQTNAGGAQGQGSDLE